MIKRNYQDILISRIVYLKASDINVKLELSQSCYSLLSNLNSVSCVIRIITLYEFRSEVKPELELPPTLTTCSFFEGIPPIAFDRAIDS